MPDLLLKLPSVSADHAYTTAGGFTVSATGCADEAFGYGPAGLGWRKGAAHFWTLRNATIRNETRHVCDETR
jgi:hypothetical protein